MIRALVLATFALTACRDATGKQEPAPAPAPPPPPMNGSAGSAAIDKPSPEDNGYVPAEYKTGMSRFKDTVVYVDGKPIGYLAFGELPLALQPTWLKFKKSINKPAGCADCLSYGWGEERYYRWVDYLKAMGLPIAKIRELHVQGPRPSDTIIATGRDLLSPVANEFYFHFGGSASGKVIPRTPLKFGNGFHPDKCTAVMIYIAKQPPKMTEEGFVIDGHVVEGVPYYGEPLRGGVRIYLDDKLVAIIKRQELDPKQATTNADGSLSWNLYAFLKSRGVDTSKVVEGWVLRDERRKEKLPASELEKTSFAASSQASGSVLLGDKKLVASSVALHTHAVTDDQLPKIRPEEED